jgi:hypothetical protein
MHPKPTGPEATGVPSAKKTTGASEKQTTAKKADPMETSMEERADGRHTRKWLKSRVESTAEDARIRERQSW